MKDFEEIIRGVDPEKNYAVPEISEICGVSKACILMHIKRGTFTGRKVFGKWQVKGREVRNYLTK